MPDRKISSAKCHICGQKVPFTYGNPNELIQHMLGCNGNGAAQQFHPSCCSNNKPCIKIIDCPNKPAKCTTCGGQKVTEGKSASLYNAPEDAPIKCTICVAPKEESTKKRGKSPTNKAQRNISPKASKTKTKKKPKKMKVTNKTNKSKSIPDNNTDGGCGGQQRSSNPLLAIKRRILDKQDIGCGPSNKNLTADECCEANDFTKPKRCTKSGSYTDCKKSTNNTPSQTCNKTVCFANNVAENEKQSVANYSPCNLIKRKGTKEMYKTTLETWTAGCGTLDCSRCQRKVVPLIRKQKNKIAFTSIGASLLLTCWPFCFLIPTMHNYSVDLYCPCCKYKLGVYNSSTGKATSSVCCK